MRHKRVTGIILKRKNIGEADMLLTVLTREHGKMTIKAKGVRKITSRRAASLDLLNLCSMALYEHSENTMRLLTEVQLLESHSDIKSDLTRVGIAYHLCELLDGLSPEDQAHEEIFMLTRSVFQQLGTTPHLAHVVHNFELQLLSLLGYTADQDLTGAKASLFIEEILERRLRARQILPYLL